jgi:hypothetical protein
MQAVAVPQLDIPQENIVPERPLLVPTHRSSEHQPEVYVRSDATSAPLPKLALPQSDVRLEQPPAVIHVATAGGRAAASESTPEPSKVAPSAVTAGTTRGSSAITAMVLNLGGGSVIGPAPVSPGSIKTDARGVTGAAGLGETGSGKSDTGFSRAGTLPQGVNEGTGESSEGSGGAGTSPEGPPSAVSIKNGVVELGSFGGVSAGSASAGAAPLKGRRPDIIIVSSARSVQILQQFAKRLGSDIYTVYLNASGTTAVMQYSDNVRSRSSKFTQDISAPESINTNLPAELRNLHQVVSCVLSADGSLKNIALLTTPAPSTAAKWQRSLAQWKFRPAYRGDDPISVQVLIGFGIDTN